MIVKYFRILTLVMAALCLASCGDDHEDEEVLPVPPAPGEGLTFAVSRQVIQANGTDKTDFILKYDGLELTEGYTIYDEKDQKIENSKTFSTTEPGDYKFWAAYKSHHTDKITIKAISVPVPELPEDPAPERTDFTKRVMLTQFTGTGCQFCPNMTSHVSEALSDSAYAKKTLWCVAHTFNRSDPAYLTNDRLDQAFAVSSYPTLNIDFISSFNNNQILSPDAVRSIIDQAYDMPAQAGVSARSELIEEADGNRKIALHVSVKAAEEGTYSVGAWLMEDSIKGPQAGLTGWVFHNNALRVVDSKAGFNNYTGIELGRINSGKTAEHVFILNLEKKWNLDQCHMAIFVAEHKDRKCYVTNVVPCPVEGVRPFDYK